jgi:hypothetical protein
MPTQTVPATTFRTLSENSMHQSVLFSTSLALATLVGRLFAAETSPAAIDSGKSIQAPHPAAAPVAAGWWSVLGSDSIPYDSLRRIPVNIGIMTATDANGHEPRKVGNSFSLTLVSSEIGGIRGVQASGAMNDVHGSVRGVQASGGLNLVGGNVVGFQGAGVNLVKGNVTGLQYSSLFNRVGGDFTGFQVGTFGNVVEGGVTGVQSASVINRAKSVNGVQHGMVNLVDRSTGMQSGLVNVADRIDGVQFGLVNIADTMTGPQIGLINIRPDSRVFVEGWTDETGLSHVGLNYGSPGWYNLVDFAGKSTQGNRFAFGVGFGGRVPSERLILSSDISALFVGDPDRLDKADKENSNSDKLTPDQQDAINGLFRVRATLGWHFWSRLAVFGGASWNLLAVPEDGHGSHLLRPYGSYHWDATEHARMWPGFFLGIRI